MATIDITDIVTDDIKGNGSFDSLMQAIELRLRAQYDAGRIKGSDYANVYLGAIQSALQQSIAFTLGVQQADKQADLISTEIDALVADTSRQDLLSTPQIAKMEAESNLMAQKVLSEQAQTIAIAADTARNDALSVEQIDKLQSEDLLIQEQITSSIADTVRNDAISEEQVDKLQSEDLLIQENITSSIASTVAQVANTVREDSLSAQQLIKMVNETALVAEQTVTEVTNNAATLAQTAREDSLATEQVIKIQEEVDLLEAKDLTEAAQLAEVIASTIRDDAISVAQISKTEEEQNLLESKVRTEQAQTVDSLTGGAPVGGVIGKQNTLYANQAEGFLRHAEQQAIKPFIDMWTIAKNAAPNDTTLATPFNISQSRMDIILANIASKGGLAEEGELGLKAPDSDKVIIERIDIASITSNGIDWANVVSFVIGTVGRETLGDDDRVMLRGLDEMSYLNNTIFTLINEGTTTVVHSSGDNFSFEAINGSSIEDPVGAYLEIYAL